jgi:ATP-dependent DNA helicase RecG
VNTERIRLILHSEISVLKGVGPKATEALNKCGIYTILDLLLYFPRDYEIVSVAENNGDIKEDDKVIIKCTVEEIKKDVRSRSGKIITTIVFSRGENRFYGKWFNQPYVKNNFKPSQEYQLIGKIKIYNNQDTIVNPKVLATVSNTESRVIPKYSLNRDLTGNLIHKLLLQILNSVDIKENLPQAIISKYKLCSLNDAIRNIHYPSGREQLLSAQRRLKYQELFSYSMKILMLKNYAREGKNGIAFNISPELTKLKEKLPYKLTDAQSRAVREILKDQKREVPMNRLVQGDVGSGKTIVAIIAMFNVVKNGYQAVMLAPTEILSNQHFLEICKILGQFHINIELLTGSTSNSEKNRIKQKLKEGTIDIIVGTHALLEENVEFMRLGMIVTDEQHRFGVMQRNRLYNKEQNADILVMTATPIPRTLSLYVHGDLNVSIIDELPPGRKKIKTVLVEEEKREEAYKLALEEIKSGRQAYVVCPLVDENEELKLSSVQTHFEELKKSWFRDIEIEILHGKMRPKDKEDIMERFRSGVVKVLISTTVIEVGVNVPNATIMIIENAERFGLSQLHQLRGRVGRGAHESYCVLIAKIKNSTTKKRMNIMVESSDGFYIAEQDLIIRGSGEMFGFRQHGDNELVLADVIEDINILKAANEDARRLLQSNRPEDAAFKEEIMKNIQNASKLICFN